MLRQENTRNQTRDEGVDLVQGYVLEDGGHFVAQRVFYVQMARSIGVSIKVKNG